MGSLPITTFTAALAALALVALSVPVSMRRFAVRKPSGDGGDAVLARRIRTQANFIEYVPIALIVLALVEGGGSHRAWALTIAGLLIVGRAFHAVGMRGPSVPLKAVGMVATWSSLAVGGVALLLRLI